MVNRISKLFDHLKKKKMSGLGIFITAGDPNLETSQEIFNSLPDYGADFIELGMPFSDPMADGPAIQASSLRALNQGMNLKKTLLMVKNFRNKNLKTPVILMGYYNPIYQYGIENFIKDSQYFGVDGFIVVDMPPEEDKEFLSYLYNTNMDLIKLLTPTTNEERLKIVLENSSGFLYYVSVTGITGTKKATIEEIDISLKKISKFTKLPIAVGFGISSQKQIEEISRIANASVVGSHIVKIIENELIANKNNALIHEEVLKEVKILSLGLN